jgi:hypothetical protein
VDPAKKPLPPDQKRNRAGKKRRKKNGHPNPEFDLRTEAYKLFGVDVTQIPGLEENALPLFSEIGRDLTKWPTPAFCFLAESLSGQRYQRRQNALARNATCGKPRGPDLPFGVSIT